MEDEVLAIVRASVPRRVFGIGVLAALGLILIYVALAQPPSNPAWQLFLVALGGGALWMARSMWRATQGWIELTRSELRTDQGALIAQVADIQSVDRGVLAFKPSNGFMLRLTETAPRSWAPGLWWCLGRRVGVGGVTNASQSKGMAEVISALIAER